METTSRHEPLAHGETTRESPWAVALRLLRAARATQRRLDEEAVDLQLRGPAPHPPGPGR